MSISAGLTGRSRRRSADLAAACSRATTRRALPTTSCASASTTSSADRWWRSTDLIEHDLFGKPLHTFPDHALSHNHSDKQKPGETPGFFVGCNLRTDRAL